MTRSPRRLSKHVREAVGEHVRDLPVQAARLAMFGVGRALLLSDRVSRDYKELRGSGPGPVLNRLRGDVQNLAGKAVTRVTERVSGSGEPTTMPKTTPTEPTAPAARPPAKAGEPPLVEPEIAVGKPSPAASAGAAETAAPRPKTTPEPTPRADATARPEPTSRPEPTAPESTTRPRSTARAKSPARPAVAPMAKIAPESLPVPDYDQATLASLRGRLRGLSIEQVRVLRAYERENAARADVLRMFENRITKLESGL